MSDDTKVTSGEETGEQVEFVISEDRIFIKGMWKGRTSKSKKGNMNMSWHRRNLFDDAVNAYLKAKPLMSQPKTANPPEDDDVPF